MDLNFKVPKEIANKDFKNKLFFGNNTDNF